MRKMVLAGFSLMVLLTACEASETDHAAAVVATVQSQDNEGLVPGNEQADFQVYKSPSCGCCGQWIEHLNDNGFTTATHHPENLALLKQEKGIGSEFQSCHTAVSAKGYVFEGHVPATVMSDFLAQPPEGAIGLAVPGMPVGSPGMEMGERFTPYDVVLLKGDGSSEIYRHIAGADQQ